MINFFENYKMDPVVKSILETYIDSCYTHELADTDVYMIPGLFITIIEDFMHQNVSDFHWIANMNVKVFYDKCMETRVRGIREELKEEVQNGISGNDDGDDVHGEA